MNEIEMRETNEIEELKKQIELLEEIKEKNRLKIVVSKIILSPVNTIIDLVFMPARILKIVKRTYEIVEYVRNKQIAEIISMQYENQIGDYRDDLKIKVDEFIKKNMKIEFMNKEITEKYQMFEELMKKEGV